MFDVGGIIGAVAPVVGGMLGGPVGAAVGTAVGGAFAGSQVAGAGVAQAQGISAEAEANAARAITGGRDLSLGELGTGRNLSLGELGRGRDLSLGELTGGRDLAVNRFAGGRDLALGEVGTGRDLSLGQLSPYAGAGERSLATQEQLANVQGDRPLNVQIPPELQAQYDIEKRDAELYARRGAASRGNFFSGASMELEQKRLGEISARQSREGYQFGLSRALMDENQQRYFEDRQYNRLSDLSRVGAGAAGQGANIEAQTGINRANIESMTGRDIANLEARTGENRANIESQTGIGRANIESQTGINRANTVSQAGGNLANLYTQGGQYRADTSMAGTQTNLDILGNVTEAVGGGIADYYAQQKQLKQLTPVAQPAGVQATPMTTSGGNIYDPNSIKLGF